MFGTLDGDGRNACWEIRAWENAWWRELCKSQTRYGYCFWPIVCRQNHRQVSYQSPQCPFSGFCILNHLFFFEWLKDGLEFLHSFDSENLQIKREIRTLKVLKHPNIVRLHEVNVSIAYGDSLVLVIEFFVIQDMTSNILITA